MRNLLRLFVFAALTVFAACTGADSRAPQRNATAAPDAAAAAPDSSCDGYRHCIAVVEPAALAQRSDVRRDSLRLIFTIAGRLPVELVNGDPAYEDSHYFLYNGWDARIGAHRVYLMEYESSEILYVFPSSGVVSGLDELPVFSPDGRFLATANWDTEAQMEWNRARVFRILPDSLLLEWEIAPELWGPDSLRWRDDSTLVIRRGAADRHPNPTALSTPLVLRRTAGAWRADSGAAAP